MGVDVIALAVPVFVGTLAAEMLVARRRGLRLFRFADTVTNLAAGISSEVVRLLLGALSLLGYEWTYQHARLVDLSEHPWLSALLALLGVDFLYYWFHRLCHRVNALWALHVVHHQSQEYNLAVALRQSWLQGLVNLPLYLPLALLGVPTATWALSVGISLIYQFFIHTRLVGKLGWLEAWLNTPSHHRVHHAINPEYIDRNHGAILIVWDKLFGTFEEERAEPVYGTVQPFESWNSVWANFDYWAELARRSRATRRPLDKLRVWFSDPSWNPEDLGGVKLAPPVDASRFSKWDPPIPARLRAYLVAQFAVTVALLGVVLLGKEALPLPLIVGGGALVLLTTYSWGALLERRRWAGAVEGARLLALAALGGLAAWLSPPAHQPWLLGGVAVLVAASAVALRRGLSLEAAQVHDVPLAAPRDEARQL